MLALALRQSVRRQPMQMAEKLHIAEWDAAPMLEAIQEEKGPLFIATPYATKLDDVSTQVYRAAPDDLARLGFAVAHALAGDAPQVPDLPDELRSLAGEIAEALRAAERPLIVSGTSCGSREVVRAAANVAWALNAGGRQAQLCFTVPESNSLGLGLVEGGDLKAAFKALQNGKARALIVLENDLYRRADRATVDAALNAARHVIAIDHLSNATTARADVVLPAATFAEADGTLVNNEGRAQRFYQVFVPEGDVQESWRWLRDIMVAAGRREAEAWHTLDDIVAELAERVPVFKPVLEITPPAGFRVTGLKVPRQPQRYSGRTAMHANVTVSEPKPPDDPDSPLAFSMEGYEGEPPAALIPRFWAPGWNSIQSLNKFQSEIAGPLRGGDPGRRLLEPTRAEKIAYFEEIPPAFERREDEWLVLPFYHIFGSEELSVLTPGVAERAPGPYVALNPQDATKLGADAGREVRLAADGAEYRLPVRLVDSLPPGTAGVPAGLPGFEGMALAGKYVKISKA
jgi:NADH-quinone oxidoreductase subunit G